MTKLIKYAVLWRPRKTIQKKDKTFSEINEKERIVKLPQGYSERCCSEIEDSYYIFDTKKEALANMNNYPIHEADKPRVVKLTITY